MKKLLSILAAIGLTATAASSAVACSVSQENLVSNVAISKDGTVTFEVNRLIMKSSFSNIKDLNNSYSVFNSDGYHLTSAYLVSSDSSTTFKRDKQYDFIGSFKIDNFDIKKNYTFSFGTVGNGGHIATNLGTIKTSSSSNGGDTPTPPTPGHKDVKFASASFNNDFSMIKILGTNIPDTIDKSKLEITNNGTVIDIKDTVTKSGTELDVTLSSPIKQTSDEQTINISYKDKDDETSTSVKVPAITPPTHKVVVFNSLDINGDKLTVKGDNFPNSFDKTALSVADNNDNLSISSVSSTNNELTITLSSPIVKKYDDQKITVTYTNGEDTPATVSANVGTLSAPVFDSASMSNNNQEIDIKAENINNNINQSQLTVKNGSSVLAIKNVVTKDQTIEITLDAPIKQTYQNQSISISYAYAEGKDPTTITTSVAALESPSFTSATYDLQSKTVTITGKLFSNMTSANEWNSSYLTVNGIAVKSASVTNDTTIQAILSDYLPQKDSASTYKVEYKDATNNIDANTTVSVDPTALNNDMKYDANSNTITVSGKNLINSDDVKNLVDVKLSDVDGKTNESVSVSSAKISGNELTVVLSDKITANYDDQSISITYKLNSGVTISTSPYSIAKLAMPKFTKVTYDNNVAITIEGDNFNNFLPFSKDKLKLSLDGTDLTNQIDQSSVNLASNKIAFNLKSQVKRYKSSVKTYTVSYEDDNKANGVNKLSTSGTFAVQPTSLKDASAKVNDQSIVIDGANLGTDANISADKVSIKDNDTDLPFDFSNVISSVSTTNDKLTIGLSKGIADKYYGQSFTVTYTLTSGETLTSNVTVAGDPTNKTPIFNSMTYDYQSDNKVIVIKGTNFDQLSDKVWNDKSNWSWTADKPKTNGGSDDDIQSVVLKGNEIDVTLADCIKKNFKKTTYGLQFSDPIGKAEIKNTFDVEAIPEISKVHYDDANHYAGAVAPTKPVLTVTLDNSDQISSSAYKDKANWTIKGSTDRSKDTDEIIKIDDLSVDGNTMKFTLANNIATPLASSDKMKVNISFKDLNTQTIASEESVPESDWTTMWNGTSDADLNKEGIAVLTIKGSNIENTKWDKTKFSFATTVAGNDTPTDGITLKDLRVTDDDTLQLDLTIPSELGSGSMLKAIYQYENGTKINTVFYNPSDTPEVKDVSMSDGATIKAKITHSDSWYGTDDLEDYGAVEVQEDIGLGTSYPLYKNGFKASIDKDGNLVVILNGNQSIDSGEKLQIRFTTEDKPTSKRDVSSDNKWTAWSDWYTFN